MPKLPEHLERIRKKVGCRRRTPPPPHFDYEGNFVHCILFENHNRSDFYVGTAKRNPCDKFDYSIGESLAYARALRRYNKKKPALNIRTLVPLLVDCT